MKKIIVVLGIIVAILAGVKYFPTGSDNGSDEQVVRSSEGMSIDSWQSDKGAKVMYVAAPELPMVDVRLVFDAGSARDGDKPGLASLTNGMLDQGAGGLDVEAIAEAFENIGANFSSGVDRDMASVHLRTLTDAGILKSALQTFTTVISAPDFNEKSFQREQQRTLIGIKAQQQSPGTIAAKLFYANMYGKHPYATPVSGTSDSVKKLTADALRAFYKKYYVTKNATIVIVGNVSRNKAEKMANQLANALPAGEKAPALAEVVVPDRAQTIHKEYASTQTSVYIGQPVEKRGDKDHFVLYVGNHILGGSGFSARIFKEIREERGLAYSAYSYFSPMQAAGPFMVGLKTKNSQTDLAIKLANDIVTKFIKEGPSEKELLHAKKNITGGFALRVDSNKDITEYISVIGFYNLPLDYLKTFNDKVNAVTLAQIKETFARRLHPDKFLTVTVGKASK